MKVSNHYSLFIAFLFLLLPCFVLPQVDSLERKLPELEGKEKFDLLLDISKGYWNSDLDKSLQFAQQAFSMADQANNDLWRSDAYNRLGNVYYFKEEYHQSIEYYNLSKKVSSEANHQEGIAKACNNIGLIYNILGDYDEAIKNFHASLEIEEKANNKRGISISSANLGNLYVYIKNYNKAIELYRRSLKLSKEIGSIEGTITAYTNLGSTYSNLFQNDSAFKYSTIAYELSLEEGLLEDQATNLNNLGTIYFDQGKYDDALELYSKSLAINKNMQDSWSEANTLRNIGGIHLMTEKYSAAIPYFEKAAEIANQIEARKLLMDIYSALSETYEHKNQPKKALKYLKLSNQINDSIYSEESKNQIARLEARYLFKDKEQEIKLVTKENEVSNYKIKIQRYIIYIFAISSLLILSLMVIVFLRSRANKKAREISEEKNTRITDQKILLEKTLSELKESEEKQKALIENLLDGVFILQHNRLIYSNLIVGNILGYTTDELHEIKVEEVVDPRDLDMILQNQKNRLDGKNVPKQYEIRLIHKDGNQIDVILNVGIITLMGQIAIIGTIKDITAQKNHEAALIREKEKAEQATKSKSIFLAGISHEIRNHMNSIIGVSEVLGETNLSVEQHEYVDVVINSGNNMLSIINEILDYSKIEAGQVIINEEAFILSKLVKDILDAHRPQIKNRKVKLDSSIDKAIPEELIGDTTRIKQVLINLVSNAIKFTEKGSIIINVTPEEDNEQENEVHLKFEVKDTGMGISEKNQKKLFIPFSQTDNAFNNNISGTGLGLAICKNLVKLMQGEIGVTSEISKGSSFWFTIKLSKPIKPNDKNENDDINPSDHKPLNILLVEDNLMSQQLTKTILTKNGHIADIAENGQIGLDKFINNKYDLVLMDIQMPVMDGIQASRLIREYEEGNGSDRVNIIAITAYTKDGEQQKLFNAGINLYLPKPFQSDQLVDMIKSLNLS
jgi:PAS domain S-box-containing protein